MRKAFRKAIVAVLSAMLVVTAMPMYALAENVDRNENARPGDLTVQTHAVTPQKVSDATYRFIEAISRFSSDTSDLSPLETTITRFGGVGATVSGVVVILQMAGVIQDPTMKALGQVLDKLNEMQAQLDQMDRKIDGIRKDLINIQVLQEEKDRNAVCEGWENVSSP